MLRTYQNTPIRVKKCVYCARNCPACRAGGKVLGVEVKLPRIEWG